MGKQETLETIWEVPDELWERIEPIILEEDPPKARGRKRSAPRQMLNGIRAATAASVLERAGFDDVELVLGGTNAWRDAGYPLEEPVATAND